MFMKIFSKKVPISFGGKRKKPTFAIAKQNISVLFQDGQLPEWPNGADCNSAGLRLRWFESITAHITNCFAEVAQSIEH